MKNSANIITLSRIIMTAVIIRLEPLSAEFAIPYIYCGTSDILDGYIARKNSTSSQLGSVLDSVADIFFFVVITIQILPILEVPKELIVWFVVIAVIRITAYSIGLIKYRSFSSLHTISNKLTGLLLFLFPLMYIFMGSNVTEVILCVAATISSSEEFLITAKAKKLQRDIKGIFEL